MQQAVECAGAPRDLGLDQGRACRAALRDAYARAPLRERWGWPRSAARLERDLKRHFPHLAESLAGLAAGAGVPARWLLRRLAAELDLPAHESRAAAIATGTDVRLAVVRGGAWIARRRRPEGGFACLELVRPWSAAAFAGVNEAGLAVVAAPARGPDGGCAAPAALLAQDCLERFSRLESALEWCSTRPTGHTAGLLLADAEGDLAGVERRGGESRVLRPEGRREAARLAWAPDAVGAAELAKALREAPLLLAALPRALGPGTSAGLVTVVVEPVRRRLGVIAAARAGAEPDWLSL